MAARAQGDNTHNGTLTFSFHESAADISKSDDNRGLGKKEIGLDGKTGNSIMLTGDGFSNHKSELLNVESLRNSWNAVESCVDEIISEMNKVVFEDICRYCSSVTQNSGSIPTLPTAVVAAGLNMSDNKLSFRNLMNQIKQRCSRHSVVLHSHTCGTVELAISNIVHQFITNGWKGNEDRQVEEVNGPRASGRTKRKPNGESEAVRKLSHVKENMTQVKEWYHELLKSNGGESGDQPLVVLLEDSENFDRTVLNQLTLILQTYREVHDLPMFLIMGVTSANSAGVHSMLPMSLTSRMYIRNFQTKDTLAVLDELFQTLIVDGRLPLRLGPSTVHWLSFRFLSFDYSIQGFLTAIKYILINHFATVPQGYLCPLICQGNPDKLKEACLQLSKRELINIARLPSVQTFFLHHSSEETTKLSPEDLKSTENREKLRSWVLTWLHMLEKQVLIWPVIFNCIFKTQNMLFGNSVPMSKRKLLVELYAKDQVKSSAILKEICTRIRVSSLDTLKSLLQLWESLLSQCDKKLDFKKELQLLQAVKEDVKQAIRDMKNQERNLAATGSAQCNDSGVEPVSDVPHKMQHNSTNSKEATGGLLGKRKANQALPKDYHHWSQRKRRNYQLGLSDPKKNQRSGKQVEQWRLNVSRWFRRLIETRFIWIMTAMPLGECCYYDRTKILHSAFTANPRQTLVRALASPSQYISCNCCDDETPQGTMHDSCIAFQIMVQKERLISFPRWFVEFERIAMIGSGDQPTEDKTVAVRFLQATTELHYLGFFKAASKRTDNVVRTVF